MLVEGFSVSERMLYYMQSEEYMMRARVKPEIGPPASDPSFETLLAGERGRLVRFCAHLTGNPAVAEDLAQETLLEAWRNQHKLSASDQVDPVRLSQWLSAVARNVCLRWGRGHGRDLTRLVYYTFSAADEGEANLNLDELLVEDSHLGIDLERDELAHLLDRALALLPPATRAVLIERYIRESPHAEIAERFGMSEDALVQRLYRGKLALRRVIERNLHEEAAACDLVDPRVEDEDASCKEPTRIWCPMCNQHRLVKYYESSTGRTSFVCPGCWQIASLPMSEVWAGLHNPKAILNRCLVYLSKFYWNAINHGAAICFACGQQTVPRVFSPHSVPEAFSLSHTKLGYHGIYMRCERCKNEDLNILPHLTIDVPEAQQFWRRHPRMLWIPEREINYAGQPALLSGFQSARDSARLDIIYQPETLKILGIHETTC